MKQIKYFLPLLTGLMINAHAANLYVFGDSLSDIGQNHWANTMDAHSHYHMPATIYDAQGVAAPLYDEWLAQALGGQPLESRFSLKNTKNYPLFSATSGSISYAHSASIVDVSHIADDRSWRDNHVGGMWSGTSNMITPVSDPTQAQAGYHEVQPYLNIQKQIELFKQDINTGHVRPHKDDVVVLWGGANDMASVMGHAAWLDPHLTTATNTIQQGIQKTAKALGDEVKSLQDLLPGQLMVVPNLPNIVHTPVILDQMVKAVGTQVYAVIRNVALQGVTDPKFNCGSQGCVMGYRPPADPSSFSDLIPYEKGKVGYLVADAFYRTLIDSYHQILKTDAIPSEQHNLKDLKEQRHQILRDLIKKVWDIRPNPNLNPLEWAAVRAKFHQIPSFGEGFNMSSQLHQMLNISGTVTEEDVANYVIKQWDNITVPASQFVEEFNQITDKTLQATQANIVRIDAHGLFEDMLDHLADYGFKNASAPTCNYFSPYVKCQVGATTGAVEDYQNWSPTESYQDPEYDPLTKSIVPGKDGSEIPLPAGNIQAPNGGGSNPIKLDEYLFLDGFHPSPRAHRIMANYVFSAIEAPKQIAQLRTAFAQNLFSLPNDLLQDTQLGDGQAYRLSPHHGHMYAHYIYTVNGEKAFLASAGLALPLGNAPRQLHANLIYRYSDIQNNTPYLNVDGHLNTLALRVEYVSPQVWVGGLIGRSSGDYASVQRIVALTDTYHKTQTGEAPFSSTTAMIYAGYQHPFRSVRMSLSGNLSWNNGKVEGFQEKEVNFLQTRYDEQPLKTLQADVFGGLSWINPRGLTPSVQLGVHHLLQHNGEPLGATLNGLRYVVNRDASFTPPHTTWLSWALGIEYAPKEGTWFGKFNIEHDLQRSGSAGWRLGLHAGVQF